MEIPFGGCTISKVDDRARTVTFPLECVGGANSVRNLGKEDKISIKKCRQNINKEEKTCVARQDPTVW